MPTKALINPSTKAEKPAEDCYQCIVAIVDIEGPSDLQVFTQFCVAVALAAAAIRRRVDSGGAASCLQPSGGGAAFRDAERSKSAVGPRKVTGLRLILQLQMPGQRAVP